MSAPSVNAPIRAPHARPAGAPAEPTGAVARIARWSATHRLVAIGLWVLLIAGAVLGGNAVGNREITAQDVGVGASAPAESALARSDFGDLPTESVLVQARDGGSVDTTSPAIQDLTSRLTALDSVADVSAPASSADGAAGLLQVNLAVRDGTDAEQDAAARAGARDVAGVVAQVADAHPDLSIEQTGDTSLGVAIDDLYADDLKQAELLSLPITLLILLLVFGALIAAGIPVVLALSSVAGAFGLSQLASHLVPATDVLSSVILLVGMAVGVDYSLFYVRREREERARGAGTVEAITVAAATSGRAVVVSGVAVTIAMAGMFFAGDATFSSLAVGTILVVAVAVVGSVTVLPALLSLLGRWVDRPRVPLVWRLRTDGASRFWPAVLKPVLARPLVALVLGSAVLLGVAAPALGMRLGFPGIEDLPSDVPAVATYERIVQAYPSEGASHVVAIWTADGAPLDKAAVDDAVGRLSRAAADDARFAASDVPLAVQYSTAGDVARVQVPIAGEADSPAASDTVRLLRSDLLPATLGAVPGVDAAVTGQTAGSDDFKALLDQRMPWVIGFVLLLTIAVLTLSFRSLTVALTAAVLNLLSVGAAYGVLVLVFQNTWAQGLLGFTSNGMIVTWLPLFLFVILFGLSMDYHVFVVSRIRELALSGVGVREAVARGITGSAGTVTSAAAVMIAVFSIFATLSPLDLKQMGVGLAVAILIDATIVRAVLLPSAMALLGDRNWWLPRWLPLPSRCPPSPR